MGKANEPRSDREVNAAIEGACRAVWDAHDWGDIAEHLSALA